MNEKYTPTEEDQSIIASLKSHQERMGLSDQAFAAEFLTKSHTVWNRIASGQYWNMVENGPRVMAELSADLDRLERGQDFLARFSNAKFIQHTAAEAVFAALEDCRMKPLSDPTRLVFFLAPTRGGKSWICAETARKFRASCVQARERWRSSYFICLQDIGMAMGAFSGKDYMSKAVMERKLVDSLNSRRRILAIDEGEFFSAESLNLIKYLLNSTTVVILICAIAEAYNKWQRKFPHEASQILSRTEAVVGLEPITPSLALKFLRHVTLEEPGECGRIAAEFANHFGHFGMLTEIANRFAVGEKIGPSDIRAAGNARRVKWRLPELSFEKRKP